MITEEQKSQDLIDLSKQSIFDSQNHLKHLEIQKSLQERKQKLLAGL